MTLKKNPKGALRWATERAGLKRKSPPIPNTGKPMDRHNNNHEMKCTWLIEQSNWEDCGEEAVYYETSSYYQFCPRHARLACAIGCKVMLIEGSPTADFLKDKEVLRIQHEITENLRRMLRSEDQKGNDE